MNKNIKLEDFQLTLQRKNTQNGLKFVHFKKANAPIAIEICSRSGSRFDPKEKAGLAHFVEHIVLDGTEKFTDKKQISLALDDVGGSYSAHTAPEYTSFDFVIAKKEQLALVADIAYQILKRPKLEEKQIESEKRIIKDEIASRLDDKKRLLSDNIKLLMYGNNPLSSNGLGSEESIMSINRQYLAAHLENILPNDMTVVSCGDCDIEDLVSTFNTKLPCKVTSGASSAPTIMKEPRYGATKMENQKLVYCILAFPTCSLESDDYLPLHILSPYLGRGRASLLKEILRYKNSLLYSVTSGNNFYSDTGYFFIEISTKKENLELVINKIMEALSKLVDDGIPQEALSVIKNKLINSSIISTQTVQSWVNTHFYRELLVRNNNYYYNDFLNDISSISKETVDKVIRKYLTKDNMYFYAAGDIEESEVAKLLR